MSIWSLAFAGRSRPGGIRPQKIIPYGSFVDGTHREGSHIDLVIVSDDFAGKNYWERIDIPADAICKIFAPIEAVAMTAEEREEDHSLIAAFARKGVALYAAWRCPRRWSPLPRSWITRHSCQDC